MSTPRHNETSTGIVIKSDGPLKLIYLLDINAAAVFRSESFPKNLYVGCNFSCEYSKIPISSETLGAPFEVTTIYHSRNFKFSDELIALFEGKPPAARMAGWCKYQRCRVPRGMVDETYREGSENIIAFVWTVQDVISTMDHFIHNEKELKRENLGYETEEIEAEDNLARQKLRAKLEYERLEEERKSVDSQNVDRRYQNIEFSPDYYSSFNSENAQPQYTMDNGHEARGSYDQTTDSRPIQYDGRYSSFNGPSSRMPFNNNATSAKIHETERLMASLCQKVEFFVNNQETRSKIEACSPNEFASLLRSLEACKIVVKPEVFHK
uniref:RPA_C domain-containing protein n=1 Tax=Caenorhabditis tropicalis TaxID=1561998 RepID=A0A1I7TLH3_9PELO